MSCFVPSLHVYKLLFDLFGFVRSFNSTLRSTYERSDRTLPGCFVLKLYQRA